MITTWIIIVIALKNARKATNNEIDFWNETKRRFKTTGKPNDTYDNGSNDARRPAPK